MHERIPPVRRQIVVPVAPAVAFDAWTTEIGLWWPTGTRHSVFGDGSAVKFVDGELVEEGAEGRAVWGSVLAWEPPELLRMTWHPGRPEGEHTDLSVRFTAVGDGAGTLVTLEHSGWERFPDPVGYRDDYRGGWLFVTGEYERHVTATAVGGPLADGEVWLVLSHTPGTHAPAAGVFTHPDFRLHGEFIGRMAEEGVLVAAGPIAGTAGDGMTIVRVPAGRAAGYVRAAQEDGSVAAGLLDVRITAWNVRATGLS